MCPKWRPEISRFFANPYLLVLPGFLVSALIILWPLGQIILLSVSEVNHFAVPVGWDFTTNFGEVFADAELYRSAVRTLIWTVAVVGLSLLIAVPAAMLMHEEFFGRGVARFLLMLPWAISITMLGLVARWALNGETGMLNSALMGVGLIQTNVQWLARAETAFPAQIIVGVMATVPFTTTIFLGGIASIPKDLHEAARMEGANYFQTVIEITLPLLKPFLNIAVVLNTIYVFNSFPIIWATTQGGPANSTDLLVTYLYKLAFRFGKMGEAAVVSLFMFAILLAFTLLYTRMAMRGHRS